MPEQIIVRMVHCRKLQYCASGIRTLCERYNLNYQDFLENGIDSEVLLSATNNDAMSIAVVEVARGWK